ncbi:hypothetical protein BG011_006097 [Mortierella polycephala]|uniref:Uncharacterized protein n=1 Tax=Mortierella polycephala TaxID=41804 RepID=A0A9P6U027_9FUNG|nr:hypothetical protein BG011_006097 [Mortierella polycephala]
MINIIDDELPFRWDDEDELPMGARMTKARLQTFGKWWPHERTKSWFGTTKRMVNAGFFYSPDTDSIDKVQCPYCFLALDGWEATDDPVHEHQRRCPTCPFFATRAAAPTKSSTAKATKSKRKDIGEKEPQISKEQRLLSSPRALRVHSMKLEKHGSTKSRKASSNGTPISNSEGIRSSTSNPFVEAPSTSVPKSQAKSSSARSVSFEVTTGLSREQSIGFKGNPVAADQSELERDDDELPQRRSRRFKVVPIDTPNALSVSVPQASPRSSAEASSSSSSTTTRKRHQSKQSDDVNSPSSSTSSRFSYLSRPSKINDISVVVNKKRKLTKSEQELNNWSQSGTSDVESDAPIDNENATKDLSEEHTSGPILTKEALTNASQQHISKTTEPPGMAEGHSQGAPHATEPPKKRRGRKSKKISVKEEEAEAEGPQMMPKPRKSATTRASKRTSRSATILKSPTKKPPKMLIEIFDMPTEIEQNHEQSVATPQDATTGQDGTAFEIANTDVNTAISEPSVTGASPQPDALISPSAIDTRPAQVISTTAATTPPLLESVFPGFSGSGNDNGDDGASMFPTTPVRKQAVSMLDIEHANVFVVDPTTPVRRAASTMDIEGWEDEERSESAQTGTASSSTTLSWPLNAGLTTSTPTPNNRRTPLQLIPSIGPRQRVKDMVGNANLKPSTGNIDAERMLSPQAGFSPLRNRVARSYMSPEQKQSQLVDRLGDLMQGNAGPQVMAAAEDALKEEVKLFRRSQNKERKQAAFAASTIAASPDETQADQNVHHDPLLLGFDQDSGSLMRTPVKKADTLLYEPTTPGTQSNKTPISKVISAIGAASRRNNVAATASPFVRTPVKKTVNLLRLEDLEPEDKIPRYISDGPFGTRSFEPAMSSKDVIRPQASHSKDTRDSSLSNPQQQHTKQRARLHPNPSENDRRMRLLKESNITEKELRMTVEEYHRACVAEQVMALEVAAETWVQRFEEESERVRRALLDDGTT